MELRRFFVTIVTRLKGNAFKEAAKGLRDLEKVAGKTAKNLSKLDEQAKKATKSLKELAEAGQDVEEVDPDKPKDLSNSIESLISPSALATAALTALVGATIGVGTAVLETGAEFESLRAQLDNMLGGAQAGGEAFEFIRDVTAKTPAQLTEVTDAFIKLQGRGIEPTEERLIAIADIAGATGKDIEQVTEALLDAAVGQTDRLTELGIRGSKAGEQMTFAFRGTEQTVDLTGDAVTDAFVAMGQLEGVGGSAAAQMSTLNGQMSNAKDSLAGFLNTAAQSGPLESAGELLAELGESFLTEENAEKLGAALDGLLQATITFVEDLEPETIEAFFDLFVSLAEIIEVTAKVLEPLIDVLELSFVAMESQFEILAGLGNRLDAVFGDDGGMVDLIGSATETMDEFGVSVGKTTELFDGLGDAAVDAAQKAAEQLLEIQEAVQNHFKGGAVQGPEQGKTAGDKVEDGVGSFIAAVGRGAEQVSNKIRFVEKNRQKVLKDRRKGGKTAKVFFDFEKQAEAEARKRGEAFAESELERLTREGATFEEALSQSREGGKRRAQELERRFIEAGRIFADTTGKGLLDLLDLRGPGSILEGRPAPESLIISLNFNFTMFGQFNQENTFEGGNTGDAIEAAGRAAVADGGETLREQVEPIFRKLMDLRADELLSQAGGGAVHPGGLG